MFVVLFEVRFAPGKKDEYLELARYLKPRLEAIDGFIDNERFQSVMRGDERSQSVMRGDERSQSVMRGDERSRSVMRGDERFRRKPRADWILSLSTWRDEKALVRWRTEGEHHMVQEKARNGIFADYHLRVCEVTADTNPPRGLPLIEQRLDATTTGEAKALAITEGDHSPPAPDANAAGLIGSESFESIYTPGKSLLLTSWKTPEACASWTPRPAEATGQFRHRRVRNIRDYGMFDRQESPQYYPDV